MSRPSQGKSGGNSDWFDLSKLINRDVTGWRVELARKSPSRPLVSHLPITKAPVNLGAVVKRVHVGKEYVILEKGGLPVVAIMDIDEFEYYLEVKDPSVKRQRLIPELPPTQYVDDIGPPA